MATVKLQNDKVVLKDGKASCECCCVVDLDKFNPITQEDCERSLGKTCGRCGPPPTAGPYANYKICPEIDPIFKKCIIWPTLPCMDMGIAASGPLGEDFFNSPCAGRYWRQRACLRFYYRIVNESASEDGLVLLEGETAVGARPLKSGIELWLPYREDKPNLFENESCGLYIYAFEFRAWSSQCTSTEFWKSKNCGSKEVIINGVLQCQRVPTIYLVDMFTITQHGPYNEWDPKCPD